MSANHLAVWGERLSQISGASFAASPPGKPPAPAETSVDMITLEEAARRMGVSVPTFRKWPVKRFKLGKVVRVSVRELEDFIAGHSAAGDDGPETPAVKGSDGQRR